MKIWLIKMLYHSLSPSEQWEAHKFLKQPSMDAVMEDRDLKSFLKAFQRYVDDFEIGRFSEDLKGTRSKGGE